MFEKTRQFMEERRIESGWPTDDYAKVLYSVVKSLRPLVAVEIGTYKGFATSHIALALAEVGIGVVHTFDVGQYLSVEDFPNELRSFISYHPHMNSASEEFRTTLTSLGEIGFAFIDGGHSYGRVKGDFWSIWPFVSDHGGIVALHDSDKPGVAKFVFMLKSQGEFDVIELPCFGGLTLVQKSSHDKEKNLKYWGVK